MRDTHRFSRSACPGASSPAFVPCSISNTFSAKARALSQGRYHVSYDDLRSLVLPVLRHRVLTNFHAESDSVTVDEILRKLLDAIPAPRE